MRKIDHMFWEFNHYRCIFINTECTLSTGDIVVDYRSVVTTICLSLTFPHWDFFLMSSLGFGDNMINSNADMFRWHPIQTLLSISLGLFSFFNFDFCNQHLLFIMLTEMWEKKYLFCSMVLSTSHSQSYCWGLDVTSPQPPYKRSCSLWGGIRGFAPGTDFLKTTAHFTFWCKA